MEKIEALKFGDESWNRVINYAETCSWGAGRVLAGKMRENDFEANGELSRRFMMAILPRSARSRTGTNSRRNIISVRLWDLFSWTRNSGVAACRESLLKPSAG